MGLTPGTRLGPYEIQSSIGAGGMGEVYKARDTRLDRSVAIKVLPPEFSADPAPSTSSGSARAQSRADRRARFEREAKTIAGLNHPHICALFDVGSASSPQAAGEETVHYLVMELLAGETLAARLEKGPLPLEQALRVATEIADALAAAHRQGVTHRDLKPANVMLTKSGAKLLDFGLAKLAGQGERPAAASLASAPTEMRPLTSEGTIVGTLQYMAPEQVEGKPADARTDIWALGAILYEMLTGKRAFEGASAASLIAAILDREPAPIATLQPLTPPALDRLVRKCLHKDPDARWQSAADVADELRWLREMSGVGAQPGVQPRRRQRWLQAALMAVAGFALAAAGAGVMWVARPAAPVARLSMDVRPAEDLNAGGLPSNWLPTPGGTRTALTWTPSGEALVFVGRRSRVQQLYVRRLDAAEARPLKDTEGAQVPAVSPDGTWVAFWANQAIRKIPLAEGPMIDLASDIKMPPDGLVWDDGGSLFFARADRRIWQVPAEGVPKVVTTLGDAERGHSLPWPLPDGRTLLYTLRRRNWTWGDEEIVAENLSNHDRKTILKNAADARYLPTGHLVFLRQGRLFAVPFDVKRLQVSGKEVPVLDGVAQALTGGRTDNVTGAGQFAVSGTGVLAWVPSPVVPYLSPTVVTVDREGRLAPLPQPPSSGESPRLSPDGRRLALTVRSLKEVGLYLYDLHRGGLMPLVQNGEVENPRWSPDGQRLFFYWRSGGRPSLATVPADGTAPPQVLQHGVFDPSSVASDGRRVLAVRSTGAVSRDIVLLHIEEGSARVEPLVATDSEERWPELSPDGRWLAYGSNVSGRDEVYVRPFVGGGPTQPVSIDGGWTPAWHPNGTELFFVSPEDSTGKRWMMVAQFRAGSTLGRPRTLFAFNPREVAFACAPVRSCYDVAPDGQRFYVLRVPTPPPPPVVTHINLIQNWFEELKTKVPMRK